MTSISNARGTIILIVGDLFAYVISLVLTLAVRYGQLPSKDFLLIHLGAFSVLIIVFILINFSAGLYDKQSVFIRGRIQGLLLRVQIVNVLVGVIFFYFAPLSIAPKANLFIYFIVSTAILFLWRLIMYPVLSATRKQRAILVGSGTDLEDLYEEIDDNIRYGLSFKERIVPRPTVEETVKAIAEAVARTKATILVVDLHDRAIEAAMPFLYKMVFSGVQIIDAGKLYEIIFDRIPIFMVGERWLVENSSSALGSRRLYDGLKRIMDIVVAAIGGIVSLIFYPFVYVAIKLEDRGPIFIAQERIGKSGKIINLYKFRSMSGNDQGKYGANGTTSHTVTKVGKFIRNTRIDELPQFWNVLKGDLSLIGPRPEFPTLVEVYEKEIPFYNSRHLVKPGLSGWAQIYHQAHPHHAVATEETRDKLSYDMYYVKNRSLALDIKIALRTLQILMKRVGR